MCQCIVAVLLNSSNLNFLEEQFHDCWNDLISNSVNLLCTITVDWGNILHKSISRPIVIISMHYCQSSVTFHLVILHNTQAETWYLQGIHYIHDQWFNILWQHKSQIKTKIPLFILFLDFCWNSIPFDLKNLLYCPKHKRTDTQTDIARYIYIYI